MLCEFDTKNSELPRCKQNHIKTTSEKVLIRHFYPCIIDDSDECMYFFQIGVDFTSTTLKKVALSKSKPCYVWLMKKKQFDKFLVCRSVQATS